MAPRDLAPEEPADAAGALTPERRRALARPRGRSVLVVEDNLDAAESLADVLRMRGHVVQVASDGRSGIALARQLVPDVVLCDIGLPDVTGYDVARALRGDAALGAVRLVAVSGYARAEDEAAARRAGFDAHLAKPAELEDIEAALLAR